MWPAKIFRQFKWLILYQTGFLFLPQFLVNQNMSWAAGPTLLSRPLLTNASKTQKLFIVWKAERNLGLDLGENFKAKLCLGKPLFLTVRLYDGHTFVQTQGHILWSFIILHVKFLWVSFKIYSRLFCMFFVIQNGNLKSYVNKIKRNTRMEQEFLKIKKQYMKIVSLPAFRSCKDRHRKVRNDY